MSRLRPGLGVVVMRGRIESEPANFVIESLPWLLGGTKSDVFWDLGGIASYSATVPPIMVNGMIKHRAILGRFHMFTQSALLKATIIGSNLTLRTTMVHYGEQAAFDAALAEATRG